MNIFLTGATGFIGSHLIKRLLKENHNLSILVREGSNLDLLYDLGPKLRVHHYGGDFENILHAFEISKPDIVVHLASLFISEHKQKDIKELIESNINFPTQILEAMQLIGIKHFINTGTSWQHYNNKNYLPVNLYAATKQAFEKLLTYYIDAYSFRVITLKLFDTYGPRDNRHKLFYILRNAAYNGQILNMSPGDQLLNLVYIDDVLDAYALAINRVFSTDKYEKYAVASDELVSLREVTKIYSEIVNCQINVQWGGRPYRNREVFLPWRSYSLVPDWTPKVSLREGIKLMENSNNQNKSCLDSI